MTTPALSDPRQASQIHLEIVEDIIEVIQETLPTAATLDCHRQMRDILTRIKNTLDHPILFAAHIIVYLVKAVRFSHRWATLVKNIATLDPLILKRHSSALSSPSSVPSSESSALSTQHSALSSQPSTPSVPVRVRPCSSQPLPPSISSDPSNPSDPSNLSTPSTQCPSSHSSSLIPPPSSFRHSLETRLRIRAFAQALQHERHLAEKLPPSIPKPDLTPILPSPCHRSVLSSLSSVLSTQHSALSSQSSLLNPQHSALSPFLHSPLFPSETFWTSKVQSLQLKILGNITRALASAYRAYLKQYDSSISSTPSTPTTPSTPSPPSSSSSLKSQASPPSHPSHPSHSSSRSPSSVLSTQSSVLSSHPSPLGTQHSPPSSHPPPQYPSQT